RVLVEIEAAKGFKNEVEIQYRDKNQGETEESDMAGVAKQLKQSDEMQTGSINTLKPEELIPILEKVENSNDKRSLSQVSKDFLRARSSVPLRNSDLKLLALSCPKLEALLLDRQSDLVPPPVDVDFDDHWLRCINVTDETLKAIGMLIDLRYLDLKDCSRITDLGLKYLADGGSKSCLYNLSLNNYEMSITDVGIAAISHNENLWALDISMLANVTDVSLVAISSRCRSLHLIFLNGCVAITGGGFRALTNCGWIGELAVVNCPNITWDDVVFVGCALEVLESLDRRMKNRVPEARLKQAFQFRENHVKVTWE
nr:hypothetical protein [Tanacetum cinerariifolium]